MNVAVLVATGAELTHHGAAPCLGEVCYLQ